MTNFKDGISEEEWELISKNCKARRIDHSHEDWECGRCSISCGPCSFEDCNMVYWLREFLRRR
jgi:hypothetical protein